MDGILGYGDAPPWRLRGGGVLHFTIHGGVDFMSWDNGALPMEWDGIHGRPIAPAANLWFG